MKKTMIFIIIYFSLFITGCQNNKPSLTSDEKVIGNSNEIQSNKAKEESVKEEPPKSTELQNSNKDIPIKKDEDKSQSVNNKTIVIDPGHASKANLDKEPMAPGSNVMKIKDGGGAEGVNTKTPEYLICMKIALNLKSILEQKGFNVMMTKIDNALSLGNIERAEVGNKEKADLVIRIHADSMEDPSIRGASMLVPKAINDNTKSIYEESKRAGRIIIDTYAKELGLKNRGLQFRDDMTGFNWSKVPVVLLEMGFLSNAEEDKLLSSEEYQKKSAEAIAKGIEGVYK